MGELAWIRKQISWIIEQIKCLKNHDCDCQNTILNQNNKFININITSNINGSYINQLVNLLNTTTTFIVNDDENYIFTLTPNGKTIKIQFLFKPGKGNYGNGNTLVTSNDFIEITQPFIFTGNTDSPLADNGIALVTSNVKSINAYNQHLEFVNSNTEDSASTLKLSENIVNSLYNPQAKINNIELKLGWKNGQDKLIKTATQYTIGIQNPINNLPTSPDYFYTRNGFITDSVLPIYDDINNVVINNGTVIQEINEINNLIVTIPEWDLIKNNEPKLIITRYKPSKNKGTQNIGATGTKHWRRAGFKKPFINNLVKPHEISLTSREQIIDFGQEHYFYTTNNIIKPRGVNGRYSFKSQTPTIGGNMIEAGAYVYLEFRLQYKVSNQVYISKPLNKLKMSLHSKYNSTGRNLLNSFIKFKFVD